MTIINGKEWTCPNCGEHRMHEVRNGYAAYRDVGEVTLKEDGDIVEYESEPEWRETLDDDEADIVYYCSGCDSKCDMSALAAGSPPQDEGEEE
jgi:hypothetical protein